MEFLHANYIRAGFGSKAVLLLLQNFNKKKPKKITVEALGQAIFDPDCGQGHHKKEGPTRRGMVVAY